MTTTRSYCRISDDRRGERLGVDRQRKGNRDVARIIGVGEVVEYVDNSRSASNGGPRPEFDRMIADLQAGDTIVAFNQDRLVRDTVELEHLITLCRERGVSIYTHSGEVNVQTADGRTSARLIGVIAKGETEKLGERVMAALAQNAEDGKPHGRRAYGWQRVVDPASGRKRDVVDPVEAAVVREIADRIITGGSIRAITADLNDRGIPTPTWEGVPFVMKLWGKQMVRHVVQRERNAGLRVHHGEVIGDGTWEPILDRGTWEQVCAIMSDPTRRTSTGTAAVHLLSGIARCGVCSGVMRAGRNRTVPSYRCSENSCVARKREHVDELVTLVLLTRLARPDAADLLAPDRSVERRDAATEAAGVRARLDLAADDYADGQIDSRQLKRITARLRPRLKDAEAKARVVDDAPLLDGLVGNEQAEAVWATLAIERQRAVVDMLLTVTVLRAAPGARKFDPATVQIEWN